MGPRRWSVRLTAAERERIFFLSVTLDPEVDTPEVLGAYAHRHGADLTSWAFLTGSLQVMQMVWARGSSRDRATWLSAATS